ncbi:MAG: hypothetical protein LBH74_02765 [Nitrososphaerota archaeon]|nr:hypothetical protein [Nitrososphaerota archaeon]
MIERKIQKSIISILIIALLISPVFVMPVMAGPADPNGDTNWTLRTTFVDDDTGDVHHVAINIETKGTGSNLIFTLSLYVDGEQTRIVDVPGVDFGSGTFKAYVAIGGYTVYLPMQGNKMGKDGDPVIVDNERLVGHEWSEVGRLNPTCIDDGYIAYECATHFERRTDVTPALGHDFTVLVSHKDETCEENGYNIFKCSRCDETNKVVIPAFDHDWSENVVAPTCTEQGYTEHICANDNAHNYEDNYVDALGHKWGDWKVVKSPSFDEPGRMERVCERCGEEDSKEIDQLDWAPATKDDAHGIKVASNAQYFYPGDGVEFIWDGKQKDDCILYVDESFFSVYGHETLTIVIKSSAEVQYIKAQITVPGAYEITVPKWTDSKDKEHNINMVWIRFDDP